METTTQRLSLVDKAPETDSFREAVLNGLRKPQKQIPSKFLYDDRGSKLFDRICKQDEYYPTRTEMEIMRTHAEAMADAVGPRARLVEYGSGSSRKIRLLLDHLENLAAYVPVDISRDHLLEAAESLVEAHPDLPIQPLCADYTTPFELPEPPRPPARTVAYYPGSTIGNFPPDEARDFLAHVRTVVGRDGGLLIGVDLKKDVDVLEAAYNDAAGVTAAFNKNLLRRMNRELDATFDLDRFEHLSVWNDEEGCIESFLQSREAQTVTVAGGSIAFAEGETIHTEYSYKYTLEDFAALMQEAGFAVDEVWTDERSYFSVQYCTVRRTVR
ncbi:MAG: L-histidine N(alpha)-methyltransferase [Bacteroidetes bacterium SW_9_63_38]|nr:MAG: L-histidine N(alpha)-methyltransferase [Bacteroidetes bacterium SW_9_63_38]